MKRSEYTTGIWTYALTMAVLFMAATVHAQSGKADAPIEVQTGNVKSLSLVKLVFKGSTEDEDLIATDSWLSLLSTRLKANGYNVKGTVEDSSVFGKSNGKKAQMMLGGTVSHFQCIDNTSYEEVKNCEMALRWELYDTESEEVVYSVLTRIRREVSIFDEDVDTELDELMFLAIDSLLCRQAFASHMSISGSATVSEDQSDPGFASAPLVETEAFKMAPVTFKQRWFGSAGRVWLFALSHGAMIGGAAMMILTKKKYKDSQISGEDAIGESDYDDGTTLTKDEYTRLKAMNISGTVLLSVGGIAAYMFWLVPTSKRKIRERLKAEHNGMANAPSSAQLRLGFVGNGFLLNGTF